MGTLESLPWLLQHGSWLWAAGLVALTMLGAVVAATGPGRGARRTWRRGVARLGDPAQLRKDGELVGAEVTLVGSLVVDGKSCESLLSGQQVAATTAAVKGRLDVDGVAASQQASGLRLELAGEGAVLLDGPVYLVGGSSSCRRVDQLCAETVRSLSRSSAGFPLLPGQRVLFRDVQAGDRVRVRGRLLLDESGGYRAAPSYRLVGSGSPSARSPVLMMLDARPKPARFRWARAPLGALVGAAIHVATTSLIGVGASAATVQRDCDVRRRMSAYSVAAAALPYLADDYRARLLDELYVCSNHDERLFLGLRAGLKEQLGRCGEAFNALVAQRQYHSALALQQRCPDPSRPRAAARAYYALGLFKQASDALARGPSRGAPAIGELRWAAQIHLLAGQRRRAAMAIETILASGSARFALEEGRADGLRCLTDSLKRGGRPPRNASTSRQRDADPACALLKRQAPLTDARLDDHALDAAIRLVCLAQHGEGCLQPRLADLEPNAVDGEWTAAHWSRGLPRDIRASLQRMASPHRLMTQPDLVGVDVVIDLGLRLAALRRLKAVPDAGPPTRWHRLVLAIQIAQALALLGDHDGARKHLWTIEDDATALDRSANAGPLLELLLLNRAALALRSGQQQRTRRMLGEISVAAIKEPLWLVQHFMAVGDFAELWPYLDRGGEYGRDSWSWKLLSQRDTGEVVASIRDHRSDGAPVLLLGRSFLFSEQKALVEHARFGAVDPCIDCGLAERIRRLAGRRIAAEALDDRPLVGLLRSISRRYARALADRRTAAWLVAFESAARW